MGYANYWTNWWGKGDPNEKLINASKEAREEYNAILREWLGISRDQVDRQTDIQEAAIEKQMQLIDMMMGMTGDYWISAAPTRNAVLSRLGKFMTSGMDPTTSVQYPYGKDVIETKYRQGKQSMISALPEGGAMYSALGDLERGKASSYLDLVRSIVNDEYNKAYGVATGAGNYGLLGNAIPGLASGLNTSGGGISSLIASAMSGSLGGINSSTYLTGLGMQSQNQNNMLNSKLYDAIGAGLGELIEADWSTGEGKGGGGGGGGGGKGDGGGDGSTGYYNGSDIDYA
jgi:hypothetical protein